MSSSEELRSDLGVVEADGITPVEVGVRFLTGQAGHCHLEPFQEAITRVARWKT